MSVKPMDREMIWRLPQLQNLFALTKQLGLDQVLWEICGGIPLLYVYVYRSFTYAKDSSQRAELIEERLMYLLKRDHCHTREAVWNNPELGTIFAMIKKDGKADLNACSVTHPFQVPDYVLLKLGRTVYPFRPTMAFILKHNLESSSDLPPFSEIKKLAEQK